MQNSQGINWWLEIIKIIVPSLIALIVPLITYLWLSKKLENFKNQLQIENYKFQTKFSLFHQKQASAIEDIYSNLSKTENSLEFVRAYLKDLTIVARVLNKDKMDSPEQKFMEDWQNLSVCFNEKRIYFDKDTEELLDSLINSIENSYKFSSFSKYVNQGFVKSNVNSDEIWESATEYLEVKIPIAKEKLRQKFRQLLSAEILEDHLEKK